VELQEAKMTIDTTRARCEDLTKRLDSEESARLRADETLDELTAEVTQLRATAARVAVLEGKICAAQRLASEREEEISKLSEDCEELRCALRNETIRGSNVASLEGRATELKVTMMKDRAAIETLETQLRESKASGAEKERALRDAHSQIEALKAKINSLDAAGAKLRAYTEELEVNATERHRLDGQLKGMTEVAAQHEQTIADLKHQIQAHRDHISALEEKQQLSHRLEDDVRAAEERAAERSRLLSAMEAEELRRSAQLAHTQAELADLQRQHDSTNAQCKALERAKEAAEAATMRVETMLHETETLAEEVERSSVLELNKLHAFACDAAENIEVHKKHAAAAQEACVLAEEKLKHALRDLREAQKENGMLAGKNSGLTRSLDDSNAALAQMTRRLQEERKAHTIAKQSQDTADAECDAALAAVERTHREYSASIEALSQQVEETRHDYAEKVATVSSQQSIIDELRGSLHTSSDEVARLKVALDQCRMERNDFETRVTRMQADGARREVVAAETRIREPSPQRHPVLSPARTNDQSNVATQLAALDRRLYSLKH
jgi:chromosome segregation ATPase